MSELDAMPKNHAADSWSDLSDEDGKVFDDARADPLQRLQSYVQHCFETYPIVSKNLDRANIDCAIADWDSRRGQFKPNRVYTKRRFGKRVTSTHERRREGQHTILCATALIGVSADEDMGCGWKPTVRHELGHAIEYEKRGKTDHGAEFKRIMREFGHEVNDGGFAHGYKPALHR